MATGLVWSEHYLRHETGDHPETPERVRRSVRHFREAGLWPELVPIEPRAATVEELGRAHAASQIEAARLLAQRGGGYLDADTPVSPGSYRAALEAAGGAMAAADAVMAGRVENAFCLVRPPGHHATPRLSMGFCLFNNIAQTALHLRSRHGLERILIVDFDVHHGNGTQEIFYEDPGVLFISLHRYPFYPGTGAADERGRGRGEGFTINAPLPSSTAAGRYREIFAGLLAGPARDYRPDFVLVSAGFDAYARDPLGAFCLEAEDFGELTLRLRELAHECCGGRLVSLLEGGYHLGDLPGLIAAHLAALGVKPTNRK